MAKKKTIVWLASYPKSGNTWLRAFLANYLLNSDAPVPINDIQKIGTGDSLAPHYVKLSGGRVRPDDDAGVLRLRPKLLERIATNGADVNLVKTHNKNAKILGTSLIPQVLTRRAIYILRHPFDVLSSYADHYAMTVEAAAEAMARADNTALPSKSVVRQFLGGWSEHVRSWTRNPGFPVTMLRYEDLTADPEEHFARVITDLGAPLDQGRLRKAIEFSSFDTLKRQEDAGGFIEKSDFSERFFRSGRVGAGRETLPGAVRAKLTADHGATMTHHGYDP